MDISVAQSFVQTAYAPWFQAFAPHVLDVGDTSAEITFDISADMLGADGVLQGYALVALAESAMLLASCPRDQAPVLLRPAALDVQVLRATPVGGVRAKAEVLKVGKTHINLDCALSSEGTNKALALVSARYGIAHAIGT